MSRKREIAGICVIISLFVFVVFFFSYYGRSYETFLVVPKVTVISKPHEAYAIWRDAKIRGRILLLFDRHLNAEPLDRRKNIVLNDSLLTPLNYLTISTDRDLIRKIYHIIPDASWEEVRETISKWPLIPFAKGVFRMNIDEGVPVFIMRAKDIPPLSEKVLVSINGAYWDEQGVQEILAMMEKKRWISDLVTLAGPVSSNSLKRMQEYYGNHE